MNKFERWCARNESKGIKNLIWYIIGGQVLVYIIMNTPVGGGFVYNWLSLMPTRILRGEVWRIITYAFIPQYGGVVNMLLSCLLTYFLGSTLERDWGRMKFTVYYLSGVLITAVYGIIIGFWYGDSVAYIMNTHWLNMSLFLAMSMLYPDAQLRLYFVIPIKMKWVAIIDAVYLLANVLFSRFPANLLPIMAIANFLIYFADDFFRMFRRTRFENKNRIDFQRKTREIQRKQATRGYKHRCVVCGRTDTDHPTLEFRYCSVCRGYPCYCEDHIMTHVHIE